MYFRDVGNLVLVALTLGFYATPIFYDISLVEKASLDAPWMLHLYLANPMAGLVTAYRQILFELRFPDLYLLAWPAAAALLSLLVGAAAFRRCAPTLSDRL